MIQQSAHKFPEFGGYAPFMVSKIHDFQHARFKVVQKRLSGPAFYIVFHYFELF